MKAPLTKTVLNFINTADPDKNSLFAINAVIKRIHYTADGSVRVKYRITDCKFFEAYMEYINPIIRVRSLSPDRIGCFAPVNEEDKMEKIVKISRKTNKRNKNRYDIYTSYNNVY